MVMNRIVNGTGKIPDGKGTHQSRLGRKGIGIEKIREIFGKYSGNIRENNGKYSGKKTGNIRGKKGKIREMGKGRDRDGD